MKKHTNLKRICAVMLLLALLACGVGTGVAVKAASANETAVYQYLKNEMGLNTAAACGVLANISKESNFNPNLYGDKGSSYGICQWHGKRFDRLVSFCKNNGCDYKSLNGQLSYLKYELEKYYPSVSAKLRSVSNTAQGAYDAAYAWCYSFEVPAGYNTGVSDKRGSLAANTYWPVYSAYDAPPVTTAPPAADTGDPAPSMDGAGDPGASGGSEEIAGASSATQIFFRFIQMLRTILGALQDRMA